jgi:hypothetical protein
LPTAHSTGSSPAGRHKGLDARTHSQLLAAPGLRRNRSISGRKRYRTRYFRSGKCAAQKELTKLVAEVDGGIVAPAAKTVAVMLDEWLAHIEHLGRSPSTLYNYRRLVDQLPEGFKDPAAVKI